MPLKNSGLLPRASSMLEILRELKVVGWVIPWDNPRIEHWKKLQITRIVIPNFSLVLQPL